MRPRHLLLAAAAVILGWGEAENWRASRRLVGCAAGGSEAVVVLGYRNRGGRIHVVNRWRVRAGLRSQEPSLGPSSLVLCGGATDGGSTEAALMARYADQVLGYRGAIVLEQESRTTWENIENASRLIEDVDRIKIVSHPMHAYKARVYLARQRPDLAARLVRAADYRLGECLLAKPLLAAYGRWTNRHL